MKSLKAYHGTYNDFDDFFENGRINWFTQDVSLANQYGPIILECEIAYNNAFYIDEVNDYLDQCDEDDFDENDNVKTYNGYFIPSEMKEVAKDLDVDIQVLIDIYEKGGHAIFEENEIIWLTEQLFTITSSFEFADLCEQKGYDCIIQKENGIVTYGILNNKNIKILSKVK